MHFTPPYIYPGWERDKILKAKLRLQCGPELLEIKSQLRDVIPAQGQTILPTNLQTHLSVGDAIVDQRGERWIKVC